MVTGDVLDSGLPLPLPTPPSSLGPGVGMWAACTGVCVPPHCDPARGDCGTDPPLPAPCWPWGQAGENTVPTPPLVDLQFLLVSRGGTSLQGSEGHVKVWQPRLSTCPRLPRL